MRQTNKLPLKIPLNFKIACAIYKLTQHEVLQIFIDHFTIYHSLSRNYQEGFSEASGNVTDYVLKQQRRPRWGEAFQSSKSQTLKLLEHIRHLADQKYYSHSDLIAASKIYVDKLLGIMKPYYTNGDQLYLDGNNVLNLSADFLVICEIYNVTPNEVLENFMCDISLAERDARWGLKLDVLNLAMALFMKIAYGFGIDSSKRTNFNDSDVSFYQRLAEMKLEVYVIRNLDLRIAALQDFYHTRYKQLTLN